MSIAHDLALGVILALKSALRQPKQVQKPAYTHTQDGPKRKLMKIDSCMESVLVHTLANSPSGLFLGPKLAVGGTTSYGPI